MCFNQMNEIFLYEHNWGQGGDDIIGENRGVIYKLHTLCYEFSKTRKF